MGKTLDDVAFLVNSDHRARVLDVLRTGSHDRDDLRAATGASSPTMGRILTDFQDRHWVERDGNTYRLTSLGTFVATRFDAFRETMAYQRQLQEVWPWLPHEIDGFGVSLFSDVVVSQPGPGFPYEPVERLTELITTTETMRGFGMALLKSGNLEPMFEHLLDDLVCEYIYPTAVFEALLSWDEETVLEAVSRDNYTVLLHDDLPLSERCGICLFDDCVSICCYDPETESLQSVVDTEGEEMRSWATSYYEQFRDEARPLEDPTDHLSVNSTQ